MQAIMYFPLMLLVLEVFNFSRSAPHHINKDDNDILLQAQQKDLDSMACKPMLHKEHVAKYIDPKDNLLDHHHLYYPWVVGVLRCDSTCSYCGNEIGQEEKKCLPVSDKIQQKHFVVANFSKDGEKKYRRVKMEEHTECHCAFKI
ncbi:unnamed protein product [Meganyctiphanes norvegica]|uniref:Platelet-derived growth factor (PDGF) family profile domain-containing protein n=1 Tax=Meganyctiphanes norvegica TaxID=48144 RepID=A0AAV2RV36_MEGNR